MLRFLSLLSLAPLRTLHPLGSRPGRLTRVAPARLPNITVVVSEDMAEQVDGLREFLLDMFSRANRPVTVSIAVARSADHLEPKFVGVRVRGGHTWDEEAVSKVAPELVTLWFKQLARSY